MVSIEAARLLLGGELTPDAIASFVEQTRYPLSSLHEVRRELADRAPAALVPPLTDGELRPLVRGTPAADDEFLDSVWATLLYAHSAAVIDPLSDFTRRSASRAPEVEKVYAYERLGTLAILEPLVAAGTVVLVPDDLLPKVRIDDRRLQARLEGGRAQIFAILAADSEQELHIAPRVASYVRDLEFAARTGWSVHLPRWSRDDIGPLNLYALKALHRDARRRLWGHQLRRTRLTRFDSFMVDTLTRLPVPDLSDLTVRDISLIRDEDAFGDWRFELTGVVTEYERNLDATIRDAARIASERLRRSMERIDRTVAASSALSALRAGVGSLAVAGSASLAAFPILEVDGALDTVSVATGVSLLETGRRLVLYERNRDARALARAGREHYASAHKIFEARAAQVQTSS